VLEIDLSQVESFVPHLIYHVAHDILNLKILFSSLWKMEDFVFGDSHGKHCL
jgi:hypothetical protein